MADPTRETEVAKPLTEKIGDTLHETKEKARDVVTPDMPEKDWEDIKHPGTMPASGDPYGTRPVSELTPPAVFTDKADLAAARMLDREKANREKLERERIMTTATVDAAAARTAMTSMEMPNTEVGTDRERVIAGAAVTGAALATGAAAKRTEPVAGERTIRQGAAIESERPPPVVTQPAATGVVVPPGIGTTTPMKPYGTVDERSRKHAEDPSIHPDWETQPQINAPDDVGIPTLEGQADAARIREGRRRSDEGEEPGPDRREGEVSTPIASSARREVKEADEKARDVKEDVDRRI